MKPAPKLLVLVGLPSLLALGLWIGLGLLGPPAEAIDPDPVGPAGEVVHVGPMERVQGELSTDATQGERSELRSEEPPEADVEERVATLELAEQETWVRLFGNVRDSYGNPVAEAWVFADGREARSTGEDGGFAVTWELEKGKVLELPLPIFAHAQGHGLGVLETLNLEPRREQRVGGVQIQVGPVEIALTEPGRTVAGVLVNTAGQPCPDWNIDLFDPLAQTSFSWPMRIQGNDRRGDARLVRAQDMTFEEVQALSRSLRGRQGRTIEESSAEKPSSRVTAEDGTFAFHGLFADRSYRLRSWNTETLQSFVSRPILPGEEDFTFVIDTGALHADVHGVVVGTDGRPLPDVRIRLTMREREYEKDGEPDNVENHTGQELRTDESGTFHFTNVPHERVWLRFHGSDVAAQPYWFTPDTPVENLRIVLRRQGRFDIGYGDLPRPDALEVWNLGGDLVAVKRGGGYDPPARVSIPEGDFPLFEIPTYRTTDDARWLVLYREGREIARKELRIVPGETVTVTF